MKFSQLTKELQDAILQKTGSSAEYLETWSELDLWSVFTACPPDQINQLYQQLFGVPQTLAKCKELVVLDNLAALVGVSATLNCNGHQGNMELNELMKIYTADGNYLEVVQKLREALK